MQKNELCKYYKKITCIVWIFPSPCRPKNTRESYLCAAFFENYFGSIPNAFGIPAEAVS